MRLNIISVFLLLALSIGTMGCKNKRISYTDMIKRENKEIKAFMDEKGFKVVSSLPGDLKMAPDQFYEIKNEAGEGIGVWINVLTPGPIEDMAVNRVTPILARFSYKAIGDRMKGTLKEYNNIGTTESGLPAVTFVFQDDINMEYNRVGIIPAPNSTADEEQMINFACNAMMLALKHVPVGSTIQMITSFREGPAFTFQANSSFANDNDAGVALYYDQLRFMHKL